MKRKIKMGMVGGGQGAFIGAVHRMAAGIDGEIELVCGAFSSRPEKARASGRELGIDDERNYESYQAMFRAESELPKDERMDFVAIVTPNHMHFPVASAALLAGFHVISDKPATLNLGEAKELQALVESTGLLFGLTQTYTGYPMVKEARHLVAEGKLGTLRKVVVEYTQGWLSEQEDGDNKQAAWRTNPETSGASGCMGDIGSHAANLAEYVCDRHIHSVCAELTTFVPGRLLDDDGMVLMQMDGGIKGILHASQVAAGEENNLTIRVYGEKAGLEWHQQEPNTLLIKPLEGPMQVYRTGGSHSAVAAANTRTPMGHPEGYLEAFANIYRNFVAAIRAHALDGNNQAAAFDYPGIEEGVRGMALIESLVASSASELKWYLIQE
jgi:predicted dehydrogenase